MSTPPASPYLLARKWLGGALLAGLTIVPAFAQSSAKPTAEKLLSYKPKQEVKLVTPSATELAGYQVDLEKGRNGGSAWVVKDASGNLVRRLSSSDGRNLDTYSYFKDGVEVYRESITPGSRAVDSFRWMNAGGSKWGVDLDKDGTIDTWKAISVEEVSQEVLAALAAKDFKRFAALLITDADITALGLPAETATALKAKRRDLESKFGETVKKLTKLSDKANWVHVETQAPEAVIAEISGAKVDFLRHSRATVLFESAGQSEWFQLGQILQVGTAWRLVDAPLPGATPATDDRAVAGALSVDPATQKLLTELGELDKVNPGHAGAEAEKHHLARANLLEKIIAAVKPNERDPWYRQDADSLSSAAQAAGTATSAGLTRLAKLETEMVKYLPGSNLAAYITFRRLQAEYSIALNKASGEEFSKIQQGWMEKLTAFVKAYPKADDAADAMLQLGMVCEFLGKEVEAKNWYNQLAKNFAGKPQAVKGEGAARRLSLEGQTLGLAGPVLGNAETTYDIEQLKGKVVIVYYWASWNGQAASDFAKLKAIVDKSEGQVAILGVNVDSAAAEGKAFADKNGAPGTHLHTPGGLDSKLASQFGVMVLPSVLVVGKDGKVLNKAGQVSTLDDEIKKVIKK
jgi:thiol-disulfide isomerase/thioredoxin